MKNKLNYILLFIITGVLFSCDDKIRELDELNTSPEFQYFRKSSINWEIPNQEVPISDSAKVFTISNNSTYPAILRILDLNNNLSKINIISPDPESSFFVNGDTYFSNYEVNNNEEFNVAFRSAKEGTFDYTVFAKDDFGKKNQMKFRITFKPNKPPKPIFKIVLISGSSRNYQLDGTASYDIDKAIGGSLIEFEYIIDNIVIQTSENKINHIFTVGTHEVKFRVKDNDNVWSDYITTTLNVL